MEFGAEQRTDEWISERLGVITGTRFAACLNPAGKGAKTLARKLVAEVLTGKPADSFENADTRRGIRYEAEAAEWYRNHCLPLCESCFAMQEVRETCSLCGSTSIASDAHPKPLVWHSEHRRVAASPDLFVGQHGIVEIKTTNSTIHIERMLSASHWKFRCPTEHYAQVQGNLWCADKRWAHFLSYCPDIVEEHKRGVVVIVERDDVYIRELEECVLEVKATARKMLESLVV